MVDHKTLGHTDSTMPIIELNETEVVGQSTEVIGQRTEVVIAEVHETAV